MAPTVFQMILPGETGPTDVLGLWQPLSAESFAIDDPSSPDITVWRVDLPGNRDQALDALDRQQTNLKLVESDIPKAAQQIDNFIQLGSQGGQGESFSFALYEGPVNEPDRQLAHWLDTLSGAESFALGSSWFPEWEETSRKANEFFEQVKRSLTHFAWIESTIGGEPFGRTTVSWRGDFETLWRSGAAREQAFNHERSLALALASRTAWLHIAMLASRSAIQLGILISTNPVFVLPAALKYLQQILEQYRNLRAILQQSG